MEIDDLEQSSATFSEERATSDHFQTVIQSAVWNSCLCVCVFAYVDLQQGIKVVEPPAPSQKPTSQDTKDAI